MFGYSYDLIVILLSVSVAVLLLMLATIVFITISNNFKSSNLSAMAWHDKHSLAYVLNLICDYDCDVVGLDMLDLKKV